MEQLKPKIVAQLTQEELAVFLSLRVRTKAISAMGQAMIESVMKAGAEEHAAVLKQHREHWNAIADKYGLPREKGHEIDHRTGDVMEHDCQHMGHPHAAVLMGSGFAAPDGSKPN